MKYRLTFLLINILPGLLLSAQDEKQAVQKREYKATEISSEPIINGILDEQVWINANWGGDFIQDEPYNGGKASQKTEFCVLYNKDNLFVAIKAYDTNPDSIVTRMTRRDSYDGDFVSIIFDSFHDLRTGFLFGTSSSGVKYDRLFSDDGDNEDETWDPNWWVKTSKNKDGWVAEMKIPFSQVRFEKNSGEAWGIQLSRRIYRNQEKDFWQHIPKDAPGFIHHFGEMTGLESIEPKKIFDITPYAVGSAETFEAVPENPFLSGGSGSKFNGGIDAKIGVTNNMTMDLTINPDFGQVEADPSEVNLSAYETFLVEKRPFFIEGNNITTFGIGVGDGGVGNDNLFYSRRIGRRPQGNPRLENDWNSDVPTNTTILGAAKLTGKSKKGLSLGFVEAVTAREQAEIDTVGGRVFQTVEPLTNYFVGRIQKDINEGKTIIGGIFTATNRTLEDDLVNLLHKSAYTGGVDFTQYFKDKSWMFNINNAFSFVEGSTKAIEKTQRSSARYLQRPDKNYAFLDTSRTSLSGVGGRMQLTKMDGHWRFMGASTWKTPGFETNDIGYTREANQILSFIWMGYNEWDPKGIYRRFNAGNDVFTLFDFGGILHTVGYEWNASMDFKNYWSAWTGGNLQSLVKNTTMLRGGPMMITPGNYNFWFGFSTDNRKKIEFNFNLSTSGGFEKYYRNNNYSVDLSYKPIDLLSFSISPEYSKSYSELQFVSNNSKFNGEKRYVFASIDRETISASVRVNLNLSPDLTFQYWGQPFIATGSYHDYKYITQSQAPRYQDRFSVYTPGQITLDGKTFYIDENVDGTRDYSFGRNDFNVKEFLSNFVVRWEYNPGSSLYLVWSQNRNFSSDSGDLRFFDDIGDLFDTGEMKPHNVFLIKFSYRFGLN
ncbi:MAG TPA: DUF5916 domain-containing protein [Bacteroidales bacterium]|nr:DUF5916 domain-containing protein [Bacteroidales bacterium]